MDTDELAARSAVASWFNKEGPLAIDIQTAQTIQEPLVKQWLTYWMVARTAKKEKRAHLCEFLGEAKKSLSNPALTGAKAFSLVETLAVEGKRLGIFNGRPTSLVSKFAFSCRPEIFSPYDRLARAGLKKLGHSIIAHDYRGYMQAFDEERKKFSNQVRNSRLTATALVYRSQSTMTQHLFEMRACDKRLMLLGGFSEKQMAQSIKEGDFEI